MIQREVKDQKVEKGEKENLHLILLKVNRSGPSGSSD